MQEIDAEQLLFAFRNGEFFHAYQPIVELRSASVPHVEALIRWAHPVHGAVLPGAFLPLIHGAGLSDTLTEFGLTDVLRDLPELRTLYGPDIAVSLNLSHRQLQEPEALARRVRTALHDSGESPETLLIEVVEDLTSRDIVHTRSAFRDLRDLGVRIILDDFGTGASSLTALTDMEYDGLKIDRSFVQGLTTSAVARSVIGTVLAFGEQTGITVVAEGVESALELLALDQLGCSLAQGYFLGRPKPLADGAQHLDFMPVAQPIVVDSSRQTGLADILAKAKAVDPRSLEPFDSIRSTLEALHDEITSNGQEADLVRCEIGRRIAIASIYSGEQEMAITWAVRTSQLAENIAAWGYSAEALAVIANWSDAPDGSPGLRIDALVRALEIRLTKPIDADRIGSVDNGIGTAFAHLGLWSHARRWWSDAVERHGHSGQIGSALCCLNLCDLEIHRLEDASAGAADDTPAALSIAICEQTLGYVKEAQSMPRGLVAALDARLHAIRGDMDAAVQVLADAPEAGENMLSVFQLAQSRARVAQALGDHETFFEQTSLLVDVLGGHKLLALHERRAQRLHVDALLAIGDVDQASALLAELYAKVTRGETERLSTLFDWVRLHADLNVRFSELSDGLPSTAPVA